MWKNSEQTCGDQVDNHCAPPAWNLSLQICSQISVAKQNRCNFDFRPYNMCAERMWTQIGNTYYRLVAKPGCWEICLRHISLQMKFYITKETHKQYSLLDTVFDYILYFGPPRKHPYSRSPHPSHVGQRNFRYVIAFLDIFTNVPLEAQHKRYN